MNRRCCSFIAAIALRTVASLAMGSIQTAAYGTTPSTPDHGALTEITTIEHLDPTHNLMTNATVCNRQT
jgi:hypothetical protein